MGKVMPREGENALFLAIWVSGVQKRAGFRKATRGISSVITGNKYLSFDSRPLGIAQILVLSIGQRIRWMILFVSRLS
jgi:hypothetical protein